MRINGNMRLNQSTRQHAFTLIELLVVVLILGILLAVALPTFLNQQDKAKDSQAQTQLNTSYKAGKTIWIGDEQTSNAFPALDGSGAPAALVDALGQSESELHFTDTGVSSDDSAQ